MKDVLEDRMRTKPNKHEGSWNGVKEPARELENKTICYMKVSARDYV